MSDEYRELLIGCGNKKAKVLNIGRPEFTNLTTLDIDPNTGADVIHDLTVLPLPFEDDTFNEIHAYEVLEHTGQQGDFRFFFAQFSEFWRILKPGGALIGTSPSLDSPWLWGDPGHTRVICQQSFVFLDQQQYDQQIGQTSMTDYRHLYRADILMDSSFQKFHQLF